MYTEPDYNYRRYLPVAGMILFFIAGFFAAYLRMNAKIQKMSGEYATKQAQSQEAKNCLPKAPEIKMPDEFFSVSGKAEKIDGQKITLKSLAFGEEKTYQVTIGSDTKIMKREMDLSPPKEGDASALAAPKETEAKFADIRVGDNLAVDSSDNIKDKTEFTAKNVYIEITAGLPAPPAAPDINSIPTPPAMPQGDMSAPPAPSAPSSTDIPAAPSVPGIPPPAPK